VNRKGGRRTEEGWGLESLQYLQQMDMNFTKTGLTEFSGYEVTSISVNPVHGLLI